MGDEGKEMSAAHEPTDPNATVDAEGYWKRENGDCLPVSASDLERYTYCPLSWSLAAHGHAGQGEARPSCARGDDEFDEERGEPGTTAGCAAASGHLTTKASGHLSAAAAAASCRGVGRTASEGWPARRRHAEAGRVRRPSGVVRPLRPDEARGRRSLRTKGWRHRQQHRCAVYG